MRGLHYSSDGGLSEHDLMELADMLAIQLHHQMGHKIGFLSRRDIAELIAPYIDDLGEHDRKTVPWLVWDLIQEGLALGGS